jgi:ATP-binding cassette subfamily C protein CydD
VTPVRWLLRRHAGGVGVAVAIGIAAPWLGALPVRAIPAVVAMAAGGPAPPPPAELGWFLGESPSLEALLAALVVAGALSFALALVATRQAAGLGSRALQDLRDAALARVLSRPPDWLREGGRAAAAKNALIAQCRVVSAYATGTVPAAVGVVSAVVIWSQALGAAVASGKGGGTTAAIVVAAVVGVLVTVNLTAVWLTARRSEAGQKQVLAETSQYVVAVNESVDHLTTLQLAGARDAQRGRAAAIAGRMADAEVRVATWSGLAGAATSGLTLLAIPLLVVAWRGLGLAGASLAVMIPSLLMLQRAVAGLGSLWTSHKVSRPAIELVGQVMSGHPDIAGDRAGAARPAVTGALAFEKVVWKTGDRAVLDGVDLVVRPGESVAIVGAGGSGKSTLLRLASRLVAPSAGTVSLDGQDVAAIEIDHLRRRVAVLEQHPALFDRTLRENLVLDDRPVEPARLARAIKDAELDEVVARLPDGLDHRLAGGGALSGSERRRVALARVLLADPDVVLIDELEAGLPQAQAESLLAAVRAATAGKTCVMVTHRPDLLAADRVAFLSGGRIVALGRHDDLAASHEAYRSLLSSADRT